MKRSVLLLAALFAVFSVQADNRPQAVLKQLTAALGALEGYSGTVMVKWPPPASLIARLRQGVGLVLARVVMPFSISWIVLSAAHRPRLAWISAVLAAAGKYLLRVWC